MKWLPELRVIALLRRIAKALEQANDLTRERMKYEYPEWRDKPRPRKVEISVPTVEEWNRRVRGLD